MAKSCTVEGIIKNGNFLSVLDIILKNSSTSTVTSIHLDGYDYNRPDITKLQVNYLDSQKAIECKNSLKPYLI